MEIKDIKRLAKIVKEQELTCLRLKEGEFELKLEKGGKEEVQTVVAAPQYAPPAGQAAAPAPSAELSASAPEGESERKGLVEIKSPIVGTFYRSPSPEADPFVNVGSTVEDESVVCIVEAMKVMNEIHSETSGVIKEILVDNATPVQFGQPLFLVEPR